jgi:hypothetical protein
MHDCSQDVLDSVQKGVSDVSVPLVPPILRVIAGFNNKNPKARATLNDA